MSEPVIEVRHLSKSFGTHVVLRDVDFTVNAGDVTCIIGASGSGKSTLLRCINLLETPTNGKAGEMAVTSQPRGATPVPTAPRWAWCSRASTFLIT